MRLKSYNKTYRVRQLKTDDYNTLLNVYFQRMNEKTVETDDNNNTLFFILSPSD